MFFDKVRFANTIKKIKETYSSQEEFSEKSKIGRTYLSQYMNMKLDKPPKLNILKKLAKSSNDITSYKELMLMCNYMDPELDSISGESISVFSNPYIDKSKCTPAEDYIYSIIYTYEILETTDYTDIEKNKIISSYNYIKNDKDYCKLIRNNKKFKEDFLNKKEIDKYNIDISGSKTIYACPVYGRISAGQPNWAEECIEGRLPIDPNLMNIVDPEECYFLRVNGESMNKLINNGAFALIRKTDWVENGEVAVVLVNGFDATLKKFSKQGDLVVLEPMSTDNSFQVQIYDKNTPIKIIGKYIGKFEMKN